MKLAYGSIYHARSQGIIERISRDLKANLAAMCEKTYEWDIKLEYFKLAHNMTINRATGHTPAVLFYARNKAMEKNIRSNK